MSEPQPFPLSQAAIARRPRALLSIGVCLLLAGLAASIPFVGNAMVYTLALGLFAAFAIPVWLGFTRGDLDYFEPIHIFGFLSFVYYGLGSIWTVNDPTHVAYDLYIVPYVPKALFVCLLGYLAFLAGYHGVFRRRLVVRPANERLRGPLYLALAAVLGILGFIAVAMREYRTLTHTSVSVLISTMAQLAPIFLFAWALGWLVFFSGESSRSQRAVIFGLLIPGSVITMFATFSDKSLFMTLIGVPIMARWYLKRKIPWTLLIVLLLVLVFVVFPFYYTYRWSDPRMGQADRLEATYATVRTWNADLYLRYSVELFVKRLALVNSVAVIVRDTPRWVPYARGDTLFMPTLVYFVPRVLWPDKPVNLFGREFGRTFRVTNYFSRDTYIAATVPGELYWNFDVPGVIVGMALLGLVMRWLYRRYIEGYGHDPIHRAIGILLAIEVAHLGASLAATVVAVLRTIVLLEAMRFVGRHLGLVEPAPVTPPPAAP